MQLVDALAELPADLLLFHVCLPLTLPYLNIRSTAYSLIAMKLNLQLLKLDLQTPLVHAEGQVVLVTKNTLQVITLKHCCSRGTMRRGVQWWLTKAAALLDLDDYLLRRPPAPFQNQVGHLALLPHHVIPSTGPGFTLHAWHLAYLVLQNSMLRVSQLCRLGRDR